MKHDILQFIGFITTRYNLKFGTYKGHPLTDKEIQDVVDRFHTEYLTLPPEQNLDTFAEWCNFAVIGYAFLRPSIGNFWEVTPRYMVHYIDVYNQAMQSVQDEHIHLIGIVRRWCKKEGGRLILFMPETLAAIRNGVKLIESYSWDGHGAANYNMLVNTRLTLPVDYDDPEVKEFVAAYERANNVTITLRKRNNVPLPD